MKTIPKLAAMRIGALPALLMRLALTCYLIMGLALTLCLFLGLTLYPLRRIWFSVCTLEKNYQNHRGDLCCAYECHDVEGVFSYTAVLVTFTVSQVGF
jgi:hypothetical protein